jgi:hypothetical protein
MFPKGQRIRIFALTFLAFALTFTPKKSTQTTQKVNAKFQMR